MNLIAFTLLSWLPLPFLGVANGIFREFVLKPRLSESVARPLSGMMLMALTAAYILLLRRIRLVSPSDTLIIGVIWLVLTVAFEFLFGYFFARHSVREMLANYNVLTGNLWLLVVLWIGAAPYVLLRSAPVQP